MSSGINVTEAKQRWLNTMLGSGSNDKLAAKRQRALTAAKCAPSALDFHATIFQKQVQSLYMCMLDLKKKFF